MQCKASRSFIHTYVISKLCKAVAMVRFLISPLMASLLCYDYMGSAGWLSILGTIEFRYSQGTVYPSVRMYSCSVHGVANVLFIRT